MKSKKHTPGPWHVGKRHTDDNVLQLPVCDKWGCIAWVVEKDNVFGNDEANAALIAAAPDLLSACKTVKNLLSELRVIEFGGLSDKQAFDACLDAVEIAIDMATPTSTINVRGNCE